MNEQREMFYKWSFFAIFKGVTLKRKIPETVYFFRYLLCFATPIKWCHQKLKILITHCILSIYKAKIKKCNEKHTQLFLQYEALCFISSITAKILIKVLKSKKIF